MSRSNLWRSSVVAAAYSYQQKARPYLELLETTEAFINPHPQERWLDLGCGSGRLIESVWRKSNGQVNSVVGVDLSLDALRYAKKATQSITPIPAPGKVSLIQADLSGGLAKLFHPASFDGITAGLCVSYAEHWDPQLQTWDTKAYLALLKDVFLLLKEEGSFIFSTNVPNYNFLLLAAKSWREIFFTWKMPLACVVTAIMLSQSAWLRNCARKGRFHYLPAADVVTHLYSIGFKHVQYRLTYAKQAWVFAAFK